MPAHRKDFSSAIQMYESGLSVGDVAIALGISRQAVWTALNRRGVKFRNRILFGPNNHFYRNGIQQDERVHAIASKAIARGRLVPQPCEVCGRMEKHSDGRSSVHAHHDDYNKPLEVRWLCDQDHRAWHSNHEPIRRKVKLPKLTHREISRLGGKASSMSRRARAVKSSRNRK